jgi:hypothetical protein
MAATEPYIKTFDPSYQNQFNGIADQVDRGNKLSQHYDPAIREQGLAELKQADSNLTALNQSMSSRTASLADREYAAQQKGVDYFQGKIDVAGDSLRTTQSLYDQAIEQIHSLGPNDPATKATLMNLIQMSPRSANADAVGVSAGLPFGMGGVNFDINQWSPSLDQAYKIAASVKDSKIKNTSDYIQQLAQSAQAQGYSFGVDKAGMPRVSTNINSVIQNYRSIAAPTSEQGGAPAPKPAAGPFSEKAPLGAVANKAVGAVNSLPNFSGPAPEASAINNPTVDAIQQKADAATEAVKSWIHQATNRTKKRPTN